jgi:hypothetical protein
MLFDGTYTYAYDAAGNRILKWVNNNGVAESSPQPGDTGITLYTYDNHNQLTAVNYYTTYANYQNTAAWEVGYGYGPFGDLVSRTPSGLSGETAEYYVNDGQDLVLVLNSVAQVTERELNGPAVDQVLASETVTPGSGGTTQSAGTLNWLLSDGQGTVQDVAQFSGGGTSIADHLVFSPFGQITYQSASGSQPRFTYQGERLDANVGLYYQGSGSSWYDAVNGVFASQGAPGYNGSVDNPFEFMGNNPFMSQLSTGYNSGDFNSGVGIMSGGGSTVPVFLGTGNQLGFVPCAMIIEWTPVPVAPNTPVPPQTQPAPAAPAQKVVPDVPPQEVVPDVPPQEVVPDIPPKKVVPDAAPQEVVPDLPPQPVVPATQQQRSEPPSATIAGQSQPYETIAGQSQPYETPMEGSLTKSGLPDVTKSQAQVEKEQAEATRRKLDQEPLRINPAVLGPAGPKPAKPAPGESPSLCPQTAEQLKEAARQRAQRELERHWAPFMGPFGGEGNEYDPEHWWEVKRALEERSMQENGEVSPVAD